MRGGPTFDHERVQMNLARLRKGGENLEVVGDPDAAISYKQGKLNDINDVLRAHKIFFNAKKGELASEEHLLNLFGTSDPLIIADKIIHEGDIQLTVEHREQLREAKAKKIVRMIHMNAVNPSTGIVHPEERIRLAMQEARVRIDEFKSAEEQVNDIVKKLRPIIPIRFVTYLADVRLPSVHAAKNYGVLEHYGTIVREEWLSDGSLAASVEIPAGSFSDLVDELSAKTHGEVQIEKHEKGE